MPHRLRVAIDCRINDPMMGVGTAVLALAKAFSESRISDQEYTFVIRKHLHDWLAPYVYGPCTLTIIPDQSGGRSPFLQIRAQLRQITPLRRVWHKLCNTSVRGPAVVHPVPARDHFTETHGFDVVHFPTQLGYLTELPTIYQPWDLQHLHYPQFFSPNEIEWRERMYRTCCARASYVCVQNQWTKHDLIHHYGIPEEKVVVIPWGSVFEAYGDPLVTQVEDIRMKYNLPEKYFLYPAKTWPHKNHEVIIRALTLLKMEHGMLPHVIFTGTMTDRQVVLERLAHELGVFGQIRYLGFVPSKDVQGLFRSALAMVFPSKFEGFGLPILEAFHAKLPVLSSNATTLPEVARDGALYFDPDSPAELAALMKSIVEKPKLREKLIRNGARILAQSSIQRTASSLQELYARTAARKGGNESGKTGLRTRRFTD